MRNLELAKSLSTVPLMFCLVVACKTLGKPQVVKSRNGEFQITIPADWAEAPSLNDTADMTGANRPKDMFMTVVSQSKKDFANDTTLDKFTEVTRRGLMSGLNSAAPTEPEKITINGNNARRFRIQGSREGIEVVFLMTTVETPEHFHQIATWTTPSRLNENEPILRRVAESFRS